MPIDKSSHLLPTRYNAFTINNDTLYYAAAELEGIEFRDKFKRWMDIANIVDYKSLWSLDDIENAICEQFTDGENILASLIKEGTKRNPDRRMMLGLLCYFMRLSDKAITWKQFLRRYRIHRDSATRTETRFLETLENNYKIQTKVNNVGRALIIAGAEKIKEQLDGTKGR